MAQRRRSLSRILFRWAVYVNDSSRESCTRAFAYISAIFCPLPWYSGDIFPRPHCPSADSTLDLSCFGLRSSFFFFFYQPARFPYLCDINFIHFYSTEKYDFEYFMLHDSRPSNRASINVDSNFIISSSHNFKLYFLLCTFPWNV